VAVIMVDVQGWPVNEVATMLGVPVGTVKSRCARGRAKLAVLVGHLREARG
jgi:RNA polymerase sigma-70 factor (ECF subfamily)